MANIMDYLDWRGDVPFSLSPFNEVDNLIFSELSFIDLEGILPSRVSAGWMPLHEAAARYFEKNPDDSVPMGLIVPAAIRDMIRRMAQCPRYRDLLVGGYVNTIDESVQKQFAALTIQIDERQLYVSYRGTDDTIVGWKENFNMSFMQAIPAQLDAVAYLNHVAADTRHPRIIVGGHSKGGNLAIYASIHCEEAVKPRITTVYSNDGPGYRREVLDSSDYREMADRIISIVPQTSVIGRMLEHDNKYYVVYSPASGLWQHDGFSWEVKGTAFVPAPALSNESEMIDRSLKKWVADMDEAQREKFVDSLYQVLTATNAKTLTDLTRDRNWFWRLMTNSEISESRKTVIAGLSQLTGEAGRIWVESILPVLKNKKLPDIVIKTDNAKGNDPAAPQKKTVPVKKVASPKAVKPTAKASPITILREGVTTAKSQTAVRKQPQTKDK